MKAVELQFDRPPALQATAPVEASGRARDEVRLLVSTPRGHTHAHFFELARFLRPGDLLVVNRSAVIPASLPAQSKLGPCLLNLSTHYGGGLWLAEPRWSHAQPGPLPLAEGDTLLVGETAIRLLAQHPGLPRLWFVQFEGDWEAVVRDHGAPIRYGYVDQPYPLEAYQTIFARDPGSAEMPSAARPFTPRVLASLRARGVGLAEIVLHTGVSSHEVEAEEVEEQALYAEPFWVPAATARAVNSARLAGRRVIAVGTTVVRALESAWQAGEVRPAQGFTRVFVHPGRGVHAVDGLLTGLHDTGATHLAMLYALAGQPFIRAAYAEAVRQGYLWHEFGDSHLILPR
ncbi:MAG TPA: S-adenosylmethionine:tRNA ribosyltransferase-isomerase [Caldilineaceae bacterium]|nr:S-adenosylmethionine:tRNA ribosyltransferase-isomerase [Caldilineaceae bacterium]